MALPFSASRCGRWAMQRVVDEDYRREARQRDGIHAHGAAGLPDVSRDPGRVDRADQQGRASARARPVRDGLRLKRWPPSIGGCREADRASGRQARAVRVAGGGRGRAEGLIILQTTPGPRRARRGRRSCCRVSAGGDAHMGLSSTPRVLAVVLPLVITTLLWGLAKLRDGVNLWDLTAVDAVTQVTALYSIVLMSTALLITTRCRAIERLYGGLDRSYRLHARLGEVALVLVVVHLLTLVPGHPGPSGRSLFVPFVDTWPKTFATVAFWTFGVLAVLTCWKKLSYQKWLSIHAWMGLPFVLSSVH